ncbi:hypothetical protein EDC01DRAFT_645358 [Geopyxis carbonaria]|nr:hypothetical protein EDC01DRAFT_645358 [Geopyxis carbonaria]
MTSWYRLQFQGKAGEGDMLLADTSVSLVHDSNPNKSEEAEQAELTLQILQRFRHPPNTVEIDYLAAGYIMGHNPKPLHKGDFITIAHLVRWMREQPPAGKVVDCGFGGCGSLIIEVVFRPTQLIPAREYVPGDSGSDRTIKLYSSSEADQSSVYARSNQSSVYARSNQSSSYARSNRSSSYARSNQSSGYGQD